jgi:26S proteasome regulatory subunit N1
MAHDNETPKPVDKGKSKAVDGESSKGKEVKKDKDGKTLVNGKEEEPVVGGMFKAAKQKLIKSQLTVF